MICLLSLLDAAMLYGFVIQFSQNWGASGLLGAPVSCPGGDGRSLLAGRIPEETYLRVPRIYYTRVEGLGDVIQFNRSDLTYCNMIRYNYNRANSTSHRHLRLSLLALHRSCAGARHGTPLNLALTS